MKISQINQIKLRKLWCNSERILSVVVSTILSALLIAGPAIATCITKTPSSRETGSAINDASQSNRIVQIVHLTVDLPYNNNHSSDEDYVSTMIALLHDGRVYTWGNNIYGGVGNDTACTTTNGAYLKQPPCHYSQPQEITKYFGEDKVVKLASNDNLAMAITKSGKVYRWGRVNSYGKVINHPTQYQKLSPHKITGYNEENAGPDMVSGGKYVYNEDTIFKVANSGDLDDLAPYQTVKPQLDGSTIRQVDHVWYLKNPGSTMDDSRGGFYVLTSKNKLLHVKKDYATTVEVTNPTIASRGGIKQIYRHYAIDNQGGLWHYGYGHLNTVNGTIVPSNHEPILDMSTKLPQPIPKFRDIIGSSLQDSSFSLIIRDINNRIYALTSDVNGHQKLTDVTDTLSSKEIKLFSGNISQPFFTPPSGSSTYYDYSFVTTDEDELDAVCSTVKNAYIYYRPISAISSNPLRDRKPRPSPTGGDANTATCVKIPLNNPDPVQPPTPTNPTPTPGVPGTPKLPGVPNTGLRDDKVVQLVHSPATFDYYGEVKLGDNETWRDQDYAGTTVVLTESGKLYAWGNNIAGGVGNDTDYGATSNKKPPVYYSSPQDITRFFNGDKIVKLVNHRDTFAAITSSGKVYYWGHRLSDKDKKPIIHPVTLSELSPYHIIGFGRDIDSSNGNGSSSYVASHPDNMSDYLAFSKDTIFALNYDLDTNRLQYHDEAKNRIKPRLSSGITILDVDHIKHRTPTAGEPEPDKGGYYTLTSDHKLLRVLKDGTTSEITNPEIKKRGGFKQLSYAGHYAIDRQGGLWYYGYREGNDSIHDMTKISTGGKLPHLDSFFNVLGPVARGADGAIYAITDTHINRPGQYFVGRSVDPINVGTLLGGKQKIKFLSGEVETRYRGDSGYTDDYYPPKDLPFYDFAFVPQSQPDTVCVGLSGAAYNRIIGENQGSRFETIQPVDGTIPSACVKLPPWDDGRPNPSPVPGAPTTPKAPGVPNTGLRDDKVVQLVHSSTELDYYGERKHGYKETWRDQDYAGTTVVLTESGKVYAWGNNIHGEVGNNTHCYSTLDKKPPCYYSDPQDITRYFEGNKIVKLANYDSILVAITDSGKMYHWGHDGTISHPVILKELSPYHIIGFGRGEGIFLNVPYKYLDKLSDNKSGYLAFSKDTILALDYDEYDSNRVDWLRYHDEEKNQIKPRLNGATILDVDHIKHRTPTADKPEPDKGGYYVLTSNHKLLKVLEDGTTNEITNAEIKKRGGFKQLSYTGHYAIDMQGGLWSYGHGDGNDPIHDMAKMTAGGKLPHLDSFFSTIGPVTRGADGVIYAITDTHIDTNPSGYFLGRTVEPVKIGSFLSKQKIKLLSGEIETKHMEDTVEQAPYPAKDIPMYDYAFVPQDKPDTICVGLSGAAYNRIHGENRGPLFETIQPVDGTIPSTCVKLPPWNDGKPNPSPVPGVPTTPKAPGVPNTGSEPLFISVHHAPIFARR